VALAVNPSAFSRQTGSPADFSTWVTRRAAGRISLFPDAWRTRSDMPVASPARVAVVVHVYFPELLEAILQQLLAIPVTFDLIVTNATGTSIDIDGSRLPMASGIVVLDVENRGRDILPLVQVVNAGLLDPYQLVLKIHTKRSEWRDGHAELGGTGAAWRDSLLDAVLGDAANVVRILDAFATSPRLGLVTADGSVLGPEFWGDNEPVAATLLRRLELDLNSKRLRFAAGSMYWVKGFVLQGLRALNLSSDDFETEDGQVNATTAHVIERLVGILTEEAGLSIEERSKVPTHATAEGEWKRFEMDGLVRPRVRLVPFYLPQFHPIPENDRWWGSGFTEWANVAAAKPVYEGHWQPKLPTDTGFYDLRLQETVVLQAALAEAAGIEGFMYYHYWFAGQSLLERPIQSRIEGDVRLPFCLMWANENWTRRWDGRDSDILAGQRYEDVPAQRFIDDVIPVLQDHRYMRIDGRAVIAVYRPAQIPNLSDTIDTWREAARRAGVGELFVTNVDVAKEFHGLDELAGTGLDGTVGFPPHNCLWEWMPLDRVGAPRGFSGNVLSYQALVDASVRKMQTGVPDDYFPGVMVAFDNTARRQASPDVWYGSNPYTFRRWLAAAATSIAHREFDRRIVFINAWNEWAEGAMLEPSDRFGSTYLLAVRDVACG
jgi:lipopolysaccharide biosynthesis protein